MDKKGKIGVVLALIVLVGWQFYTTQQMRESRLAQEQAEKERLLQPALPSTAPGPSSTDHPADAVNPAKAPVSVLSAPGPVTPSEPKQTLTLKSPEVEWTLSSHGGGIEKVTLLKHSGESAKPVVINEFGKIPIGALTEAYETPVLESFALEAGPDGRSATLKKTDARNLEITKQFSLVASSDPSSGESYQIELQLTFANRSGQPLTVPAFAIRAGSSAPLHIKDMPIYTGINRMLAGSSKASDVTWFDGSGFLGFGKNPRPLYSEQGAVSWVGINNQYYCTLLTALGTPANEVLGSRFNVPAEEWSASGRSANAAMPYAIDGALRIAATGLEPGKEITRKFAIYAGPREFSRLQALKGGQEEMLDFGTFSWVSRILLSSMNGLHSLFGSYAAAIVVLTVIIKSLLWPLQNKSTASMKRMQELQPKMAAIRQKYADDPQRLNEELLQLYKKYGVNPASGCLPMLIQLPLFFGFYNMLGKAVELRNSPFLWVQDLSQPDTVAHLAGYPINVLPLVMAVTMLWQMQLTPKTGDPVQQRVFMFMPLIFIAFCYNFAAALSLYWTVQNIFTIVQLTFTNKQNKADLQKAPSGGKKA
jgi:YidC/Oxa1 family membrane protein insertase